MKLVHNQVELVQLVMKSGVPAGIAAEVAKDMIEKNDIKFPAIIGFNIVGGGDVIEPKVFPNGPEPQIQFKGDLPYEPTEEKEDGNSFMEMMSRAQDHLLPEELNQLAKLFKSIEDGEKVEQAKQSKAKKYLDGIDMALRKTTHISNSTSRGEITDHIGQLQEILLALRSEVMKNADKF